MAGKKRVGTDIFSQEGEKESLGRLLSLGKESNFDPEPGKGKWMKVTVLLKREDVERIRKLQDGLRNNDYGEYSKAEILSFAINNLYVADFPEKKQT
jgi:hypothetical protein